jgi:hypothetical protein
MSATSFMYLFSAVASPWLIALMRRRSWDDDMITVISVVFAGCVYLAGQLLDQTIGWPPSENFWLGLAATYGLQSGGYEVSKRVAPNTMKKAEEL